MEGHPLLHESAIPFSLRLSEHGGELECLSPLRVRPGKRLTCIGSRDNKLVVAKIFHATPSGLRHWKRDLAGLQALHGAGIVAPQVRLWDSDTSLDLACVVTEFLNEAQTFQEVWQDTGDPAQRAGHLRALLDTLARQHAAGLLHADPHLRNFLVDKGRVVTVDGGDILAVTGGPAKQQCIDNLGLLLAQFPAVELDAAGDYLGAYLAGRGWPDDREHRDAIAQATAQARARRWNKYSRKVYRECSAFVVRRSSRYRSVCRRPLYEGEIREFLDAPESFLQSDRARCVKDGNSSSVFELRLDGAPRVVKRYNIKSPGHALQRALQPTRAAHSWRNGLGLEFHGILTAPVLAFQEQRFGPLRARAYLLMDRIEGPSLRDYRAGHPGADSPVVEQAAGVILRLRSLCIGHGDMKASNFIVTDNGVAVLDLDSMRFFRSQRTYRAAGQADTQRFLDNWRGDPAWLARFEALLAPTQ